MLAIMREGNEEAGRGGIPSPPTSVVDGTKVRELVIQEMRMQGLTQGKVDADEGLLKSVKEEVQSEKRVTSKGKKQLQVLGGISGTSRSEG